MQKFKPVLFTIPFIIGFILIRMYENSWFYDPFLVYFKGSYQNTSFPDFESFRLFFNLFLRYFLNTLLSLGIIYVMFKNKEFLKVASVLYAVFFVVLIAGFFMIVRFTESDFFLFYIRKFLIQPLFLLLFLPAFYFQTKNNNQEFLQKTHNS
ncbi:MAG: exosortase F system-associated protein [Flavobacteriaceae bacterium]